MKNKSLHKGIFQAFIFNIIIFVILSVFALNYFYPEFLNIEQKKKNLTELQNKYRDLKNRGLSYQEFTELHKTLGKKLGLENNVYLSNVLKEFSKDDYEKNFINNGGGNYKNFIETKEVEVKKQKSKLDDSGVAGSIKKILPSYTEDSTITEDSLTDFKFINYIETLLNNFRLKYNGAIGIGNLKIEESVESNKLKGKENQLEGKIYNFTLQLDLTGKKKNIIDFIHYLENVGNIKILKNGEIEIEKPLKELYYINDKGIKVANNFANITRYFLDNKDIYNNLVVDIKSIKFKDYLDSSDLPTGYSKGETFIGFIKKDKDQIDEKYNVSLVLKFYVKGLPIYKIKSYIRDVSFRYRKLMQYVSGGIKYGEKNKSKLKYLQRASLKKLKEYNFYLQQIAKDINELQKPINLRLKMGTMYKKAQNYNDVFEVMEKGLDIHLKRINMELYETYKKVKINKN